MSAALLPRFFTEVDYDRSMSSLHQHRRLNLSYPAARSALHRKLAPLAASARASRIELRLHLPLLKASRDVEARFAAAEDRLRFDELWSINWHPYGDGPFPDFEGTIAVRSREDGSCELELDGSYEPPLGHFGKLFDAVLGARIASATAREFLADLATQIEHDGVENG